LDAGKGPQLIALKKLLVVTFMLCALGVWNHAEAAFPTAVTLITGHSISYDNLTFTVSSCTYVSDGSNSSCSTLGDKLEVVASNRGQPTFEIIGGGTGNASNALYSGNTRNGPTSLTVGFTITETSNNNHTTVTSFSNAITGTSSSSVTSNEVYSTYAADSIVSSAPTTSAGPFTSPLTSSGGTMSVSLTLGLASGSTTALQLATDALHFSPAPEPATFALLGTGLAGLTAAKRRRRSKRDIAATPASTDGLDGPATDGH
jgi:hypothetical protein